MWRTYKNVSTKRLKRNIRELGKLGRNGVEKSYLPTMLEVDWDLNMEIHS